MKWFPHLISALLPERRSSIERALAIFPNALAITKHMKTAVISYSNISMCVKKEKEKKNEKK